MPLQGAYVLPHPPLAVPEVGKGDERRISETLKGYDSAAQDIAKKRPDTIVLLSPHAQAYADYFHVASGENAHGSFARFAAPEVVMTKTHDQKLIAQLEKTLRRHNFPGGTRGEQDEPMDHGAMVPLYFVDKRYKDYRLVRLSISGLPLSKHYQFGQILQEVFEATERNIVVIASGDLSHRLKKDGPYGFAEEGPRFDKRCVEALRNAEFDKLMRIDHRLVEKAGECGLRSFVVMAGALDQKAVKPTFHAYEGPFGVGYATLSYDVLHEDGERSFGTRHEEETLSRLKARREKESAPVRFARRAVEKVVETGTTLKVGEDDKKRLDMPHHGAFVTLKKEGQLRGCIGTSFPSKPTLAEEIAANAESAALKDPRFPRVSKEELPYLEYSVDVLKPPEKVERLEALDAKRYGVLVESAGKAGLLLPDIDGVETPEDQVRIALNKAGISEKEPYTLKRFEVVRYF